MNRFVPMILIAFSVSAAAFMALGQTVEPPPAQPTNEPGVDPANGPPMDAAAQLQAEQLQAEQLQAAQDAADAMDATTQQSPDDTTQPTSQSSTEPSTQDTTEPTTGPSTRPRPKRFTRSTSRPTGRGAVRWSGTPTTGMSQRPMSSEYAVLESKSIFVKGHAADMTHPPGGPQLTITTTRPHTDAPVLFNGVTDTNDVLNALLEDTGSGKTTTVKVGDAIGRGKVTKISMDALEYESGGKTMTVRIGQSLDGADVSASTLSPSSAPSGGGPDEVPNDIIERLKRKRAAEQGG